MPHFVELTLCIQQLAERGRRHLTHHRQQRGGGRLPRIAHEAVMLLPRFLSVLIGPPHIATAAVALPLYCTAAIWVFCLNWLRPLFRPNLIPAILFGMR